MILHAGLGAAVGCSELKGRALPPQPLRLLCTRLHYLCFTNEPRLVSHLPAFASVMYILPRSLQLHPELVRLWLLSSKKKACVTMHIEHKVRAAFKLQAPGFGPVPEACVPVACTFPGSGHLEVCTQMCATSSAKA